MMETFQGYITDLDGTLCDTREANIMSYQQAFADAGLLFDRRLYERHFGLRFAEMMRILAPTAPQASLDLVSERKSDHYKNNLDCVQVNEELVRLLRYVKSCHAKVGLATTARQQNAVAVLEHFDLRSLFDECVFGEDVVHAKPDPECYRRIIERLNLPPQHCLIFEDTGMGVAAATAAGAYTIRVTL